MDNVCARCFSHFFRERSFKSRQNRKARKTWRDSKRRFSIYCSWVLCLMDCLQFPLIRVEAVSWTQRFLTRKFEKKKVYLWQTNLKANVFRNSMFQINRKKNASGRQRLTSSNRAAFFVCMFVCKSLFKHGKSSVNLKLKTKPKYNCFTWLPCGNPIYQLPSWYFA